MVGGRTAGLENEVIYRMVWPDRTGTLATFLTLLEPDWNISILHYRKTGGAYAYICIGIQIPEVKRKDFEKRMTENRYVFTLEQNNPACKLFLS